MLRPVFHMSVASINLVVIWYDMTYIKLPFSSKKMEEFPLKSRVMFLTYWCLILQTVYHFIALLNDVFGTNARTPKKSNIIRQIKDSLFALSFTTAIYVSLAFWGIYAIDKDLIFPDHIEKLYPPIINHVMHTTVSLFIIIELLTSYINYPSRKVGFTILLSFYVCYIVWFFTIYAKTGAWVYPVFNPLNWPLRILFMVLSLTLASGLYIVGEKLNSALCSNTKEKYANGIKNGTTKGKKRT